MNGTILLLTGWCLGVITALITLVVVGMKVKGKK
jgi:hypothetical protein